MERDRVPLEELRQVAEDTLSSNNGKQVPLRKTGCLGPCSDGHIMGLADEQDGVYLFKQMNDEDTVRTLADTASQAATSGRFEIPASLKPHLEAKLSSRSIPEIPFED